MTDDSHVIHNHYLAGSESIVFVSDFSHTSNVGRRGRYLARLSTSCNPCIAITLCLQWYKNDTLNEGLFPLWTQFSSPCPCTFDQAFLSGIYSFHSRTPTSICFAAIFPGRFGEQTKCCYAQTLFFFGLSGGSLLLGPPLGGTAHRYHPWINGLEHWRSDIVPFQHCCVDSSLCHLYFERRPSIDCSNFLPSFFAIGRGDPHVKTLDGRDYTFNGLGEYMIFKSVDDSFVFQGRTQLVNGSTAASFSAFAAGAFAPSGSFTTSSLDSTVVHVELANNSSLRIWACCYSAANDLLTESRSTFGETWRDITSEVFDLVVNEGILPLRNVVLSRKMNSTVELSFSSGISLEVQQQGRLLTFVISAPEKLKGLTKGLLGRWDDDETNDFVSRSGIEILINSTNRDIHNQFGQTCESWPP